MEDSVRKITNSSAPDVEALSQKDSRGSLMIILGQKIALGYILIIFSYRSKCQAYCRNSHHDSKTRNILEIITGYRDYTIPC